jgi:hypothetical protein
MRVDIDIAAIEEHLDRYPNTKLIVLDPVSNHLGDIKMNDEQSVRPSPPWNFSLDEALTPRKSSIWARSVLHIRDGLRFQNFSTGREPCLIYSPRSKHHSVSR